MFSKSAFGILKQKALQGLQNNFEHVGIHSNRLENSVLKSDDPRVTQLTRELQMVIDSLKSISKSSALFYNSIKPVTDANTTVEEALGKLGLSEDIPLRTNARGMVQATNTETLREELKELVVAPIDKKLSLLADLKARVMERGIMELELRHCEEVMNGLKAKAPGSGKLSEAEDRHANKMVVYHQFNANLMDDLDNLRVERYDMVYKALLELQKCQQRFFAGAAASMQTLCDAEFDLPCPELPEPIIEIIKDDNNKDNTKHSNEDAEEADYNDDAIEEKSAGGMAADDDFSDMDDTNNDAPIDEEDHANNNQDDNEINQTDVSLVSVECSIPEVGTDLNINDTPSDEEQPIVCEDDTETNETDAPFVVMASVKLESGPDEVVESTKANDPISPKQMLPPLADMLEPILSAATAAYLATSTAADVEEEPIVCEDEKSQTHADKVEGVGTSDKVVEKKSEVAQQMQESVDRVWEQEASKLEEGNDEDDYAEEFEDDEELPEISQEELAELI